MDDAVDLTRQAQLLGVIFHSLAVFGVTWLLRYTEGPGHIFRKIRRLAGIEYYYELDGYSGESQVTEVIPENKHFAEVFGCFWCLSVYISFFMILVLFPNIRVQAFVLLWWGSIGISGFMHEIVAH